MSKEQWIDAREMILTDLIEDFNDRYGRYPSVREEAELEMSITEDELRDKVSMMNDSYDGEW